MRTQVDEFWRIRGTDTLGNPQWMRLCSVSQNSLDEWWVSRKGATNFKNRLVAAEIAKRVRAKLVRVRVYRGKDD